MKCHGCANPIKIPILLILKYGKRILNLFATEDTCISSLTSNRHDSFKFGQLTNWVWSKKNAHLQSEINLNYNRHRQLDRQYISKFNPHTPNAAAKWSPAWLLGARALEWRSEMTDSSLRRTFLPSMLSTEGTAVRSGSLGYRILSDGNAYDELITNWRKRCT